MMNNKTMTGQESLELIARMIRNTQDNFERGAGRPFLIWGYTSILISAAVWFTFRATLDYRCHWLWFAIPVIGGLLSLLFRGKSDKRVKTYIDRVIGQVWLVVGICAALLAIYSMFFNQGVFPILFLEAFVLNAGVAITGGIIRLRYIQVMGFVGILLSFCLLFVPGINQIWVFAAIILGVMVLPGHLMDWQARRAHRAPSES